MSTGKLILNSDDSVNKSTPVTSNILVSSDEHRLNISLSKKWLAETSAYDINKSIMVALSPLFLNQNKNIIPPAAVDSMKSFKHIAFFIDHSAHYTGGRYSIYHQAVLLAQYTRVTVVTNSKPPFYDDFKDYYNDNFHLEINQSFGTERKNNDFDVVVGCPVMSGQYAYSYSQMHKIKLYMVVFESPNWVSKYRTGADAYEEFWAGYKKCCLECDKILVPSHESKKYVQEWLGIDKPIDVIYPCINQVVADRYKHIVKKTDDKINIIYISRMIPSKSPLYLFKHLPKDKYRIHIIGKIWKDSENVIKVMKDEVGIEIIVHGKLSDEDKFKLLSEADVMIFPTAFEGFGMPPMEALYFGVPVVANDLPVLREIYKDNILYADMRNEQEFIHTVEQAAQGSQSMARIDWVYNDGSFSLIKNCANTLLDVFEIPKITTGTIVYNGADYIEYAIKSVYPLVNQIIIVDGSVEKYGAQTVESNDGTIEIMRKFKEQYDILDKIEFVLRSGTPWKDKIEMQNEIAKRVTGKYYLKLDSDEIWSTDMLLDCIKMLEKDTEITVVDMPFNHFWLNFKTVAKDAGGKWSTCHPRLWRWKQGFVHRKSFNYFQDSKHDMVKVGTPQYKEVEYKSDNENFKICHFGYVRTLETLQNKIYYYKTRGIEKYANDTVTNWKPGMPTQPTQQVESWSEPFTGVLPSVLDSHPYKNLDDIRTVESKCQTETQPKE